MAVTADLYINGKDARTEYGVALDENALSVLMAPAPMKENVRSTSRLEHGTNVSQANPRVAERQLSITLHIYAQTEADFMSKYAKFCTMLQAGFFTIVTRWQPTIEYHLEYNSCTQFSQFRRGLGKFTLRCTEPNPSNRAKTSNI